MGFYCGRYVRLAEECLRFVALGPKIECVVWQDAVETSVVVACLSMSLGVFKDGQNENGGLAFAKTKTQAKRRSLAELDTEMGVTAGGGWEQEAPERFGVMYTRRAV